MDTLRNILFLGTVNGARSVMAQRILARLGEGRFRAFSAGSRPSDGLDSLVVEFLRSRGHAVETFRPKTWDDFAGEGAPALDIVITLSNSLIGDICSVHWTGRPVTTHWPLRHPTEWGELENAYDQLESQIERLVALPFASLDQVSLQAALDAIGRP